MKYKFEEFYFENDKTYSSEVYWNLYDKDHKAAIKKYEGHIFAHFVVWHRLLLPKEIYEDILK